MNQTSKHAVLCPNCRRLISPEEARCPYCGVYRPASRLRQNPLVRLFYRPSRLIAAVVYLNAGFFVLSILLSAERIGLSANPLRFLSPDTRSLLALGATGIIPIDHMHRWWSLLSANYLHGGILHIFFNMVAFRQIAGLVVREYGAYRMFTLYTAGGILGFLISYLANTYHLVLGAPALITIGSSAAVCSLIGAALYYGKSRGGLYGTVIYRQIGGWALAIFAFGFIVPGIDNWGHGGGLAAGIALGYFLGYHERREESVFHRALALAAALVTVMVLGVSVFSGLYYRVLS